MLLSVEEEKRVHKMRFNILIHEKNEKNEKNSIKRRIVLPDRSLSMVMHSKELSKELSRFMLYELQICILRSMKCK